VLRWLVIAIAAVAAAYQLAAILAAWMHRRRKAAPSPFTPSVSILKPVRGADPGFYEAIRSNLQQDYPDFELLAGVSDPEDPAIAVLERLRREFPARPLRILHTRPATPNAKAGVLAELERASSGSVLILADADIQVPPAYLERVIAPLADPAVGLVTCMYRARAQHWPARFEALGISTDFAPGTMVAPLAGAGEFALGSTIAVRRADLERIGGIMAVADYLADDYQIGSRIHALGLRCLLSEVVVETHLTGERWSDVWNHQVRWARTIRVSRLGGYAGLPVTHATTWAVVAAAAGLWPAALVLIMLRFAMALTAGWIVLRDRHVLRLGWLIPIRDLWGTAVWVAGLFGNTVDWRGERLRLTPEGRIRR
jgi:ceramide glucosyltransferase